MPVTLLEPLHRLAFLRRPQSVFSDQLLQHIALHGEIDIHPLELGALRFEFLDTLQFGGAHPSILALPVVIGRLADAVLAAHIRHFHSGVGPLEDRHNLSLGESAFLHWSGLCFPSQNLSFPSVSREGKLTS